MKLDILATFTGGEPWFIIIIVVLFFALLGTVTFIIYRSINKHQKDEPKPTEEEVAKEELDRLLETYDENQVSEEELDELDEEAQNQEELLIINEMNEEDDQGLNDN